jgi:peptidoglycan/LPS O-acetylase OafA/YrhL
VLPAYYIALAGSLVLLADAAGTPGVRLAPAELLPLFAVFAQNLNPATIMKVDPPMWTLVVEVAFYLVLPLFGAFTRRVRWPVMVPLVVLAGGLMYDLAIAGRRLSQPWTKALPALLPLFAVGMLLAHLPDALTLTRRARCALLAAAAGLIGADGAWHQAGAGYLGLVLRDLPAAAGCALLILAARDLTPGATLARRVLAWIGTVSFGLYLWHVPVLWWLRSQHLLPLDPLTALPAVLGPSLVLAALSWHLVERPVMRRTARAAGRPPWSSRAPEVIGTLRP